MSFQVPEPSRVTSHPTHGSTPADGNNGAFDLESVEPGWRLFLLASDGAGWEHVSIHAYRATGRRGHQARTPTWREMAFVKDLCWSGDDVVVQFHPRKVEYVNAHPHVLHLWRPTTHAILTPDPGLVGPLQETT